MLQHLSKIQAHGALTPPVTETVFSSHITTAIVWERIGVGNYRASHPFFVTGHVFCEAQIRAFAVGGEMVIDVVDSNAPGTNAVEFTVLDSSGVPCDEFLAQIHFYIKP